MTMTSALRSPAFARALPFALYIAFLALNGVLPDDLPFDARWLYPLRVG
ncbi:MAG: CPBP family intramembrane metalloprotease, partial [Betaproteobacteria bacterium]|nr:CPBP family intramembrane metalloprotease [Betaproteobacteria bacterium]